MKKTKEVEHTKLKGDTVTMMNEEWILTIEDTPPVEKPYKNLSREVVCLLYTGEEKICFFDYTSLTWYNAETIKKQRNVKSWRDK